jgi:hypothetical protein
VPRGKRSRLARAAGLWSAQIDRHRLRRQHCINHRTGNLFGTTCVCASLCYSFLLLLLHFCPSVLAHPSALARTHVQKPLRSFIHINAAVRWEFRDNSVVLLYPSFLFVLADVVCRCHSSSSRQRLTNHDTEDGRRTQQDKSLAMLCLNPIHSTTMRHTRS